MVYSHQKHPKPSKLQVLTRSPSRVAGPSADRAGSSSGFAITIVPSAVPASPPKSSGRNVQEYYVKLKQQSYMRCCWIPRDEIVSVGQRVHRGLLARLRKFDERHAASQVKAFCIFPSG